MINPSNIAGLIMILMRNSGCEPFFFGCEFAGNVHCKKTSGAETSGHGIG